MKKLFLGVVAACVATAARAADLKQGLVLHYSFDDAAGSVVRDSSGSGVDGVNSGAVPETGGVRGGCMRFDGLKSFVQASRNPTTNGQHTVSLWFKPDSVALSALNGRNMIAMNRRYQIGFATNGPHLRLYSHCLNATAYGYGALRADSGIFDLQQGRWNHAVLVVDGGAGFFLNGRPLGYITGPGANRGDLQLLIGALNNDSRAGPRYHFAGLIDEVRIYDHALTDEEITALFRADAPKDLLPPPPVALGPSYVVKDGRFFLREEKDGKISERELSEAEVSALLAGAGAKTGGGTEQEGLSVCEIGFSNDAAGDQDVTCFLPEETLHVRMLDVDMSPADTNYTVQVFLSQEPDAAGAPEPKRRIQQLSRSRGGVFKGGLPLAGFQPGTVWVSVVANHGGTQPVLMRTSRIQILDRSKPPAP